MIAAALRGGSTNSRYRVTWRSGRQASRLADLSVADSATKIGLATLLLHLNEPGDARAPRPETLPSASVDRGAAWAVTGPACCRRWCGGRRAVAVAAAVAVGVGGAAVGAR
jgi:hypothetical protein